MAKLSITAFCIITLIGFRNTNGDIGEISGYPQVDVNELHPLTMSWNQVHYLVRENLLEIDQLRKMHDEFYKELYDCFGLETCLRHAGVHLDGPPSIGGQLGAGALLASLQRERQQLEGRHSELEMGIRQLTDHVNEQSRNYGHSSSSSYSYSSSSSSRSQSGGYPQYQHEDDQGPQEGRG